MEKKDFLQPLVEEILEKIDFINRFESISLNFQKRNESFIVDKDTVLDICRELCVNINYSKSKEFYIKEKLNNCEFGFGFTIRFQSFDFAMSVKAGTLNIFSSAPWHFFVHLMSSDTKKIDRIKVTDYADLKLVLEYAFSIYKDFKSTFMQSLNMFHDIS